MCRAAGTSVIRAPQQAGPSAVASHGLKFKVFTAGQTQGFPASAGAVDLALGPDGSMWFTDDGTPAIGRVETDGTITGNFERSTVRREPLLDRRGARRQHVVLRLSRRRDRRGNAARHDYRVRRAAVHQQQRDGHRFRRTRRAVLYRLWLAAATRAPNAAGQHRGKAASGEHNALRCPLHRRRRKSLVRRNRRPVARRVVPATRAHPRLHATADEDAADQLPCCPNQAPKSIAVGADGNPWFTTLDFGHRNSPESYLGTLKAGKVRLIRIRTKGLFEVAYPSGIAVAKDGFWITGGDPFTDNGALWHIGADGKQSPYDLPYDPLGLAVDAAGNPWFTSKFSGSPSRIVEVLR